MAVPKETKYGARPIHFFGQSVDTGSKVSIYKMQEDYARSPCSSNKVVEVSQYCLPLKRKNRRAKACPSDLAGRNLW